MIRQLVAAIAAVTLAGCSSRAPLIITDKPDNPANRRNKPARIDVELRRNGNNCEMHVPAAAPKVMHGDKAFWEISNDCGIEVDVLVTNFRLRKDLNRKHDPFVDDQDPDDHDPGRYARSIKPGHTRLIRVDAKNTPGESDLTKSTPYKYDIRWGITNTPESDWETDDPDVIIEWP